MNIQPRDARICKDGRNGELDLRDKLTVIAQGFCALNDAVLNEEPGDDADKHKSEEVDGERVVRAEIDLHHFHGFDTDRKGEPVNENRERGLDDRPAGADNGALVCFNQLVFGEQKDLFSKSFVFLENVSNQKTTSLQQYGNRQAKTIADRPHFSYFHYITFPAFVNQSYCQEKGFCRDKIVNIG